MYCRSANAVESIEPAGIWFPANGCPVCGSINWIALPAKLPARMSAVGTVAY